MLLPGVTNTTTAIAATALSGVATTEWLLVVGGGAYQPARALAKERGGRYRANKATEFSFSSSLTRETALSARRDI